MQHLLRPCGLLAEFLGGHFNHFAIEPDVEWLPVSHVFFDYLLYSCFESHFSTLCYSRGTSKMFAGGLVRVPILRNQSVVCVWFRYTESALFFQRNNRRRSQ